MLGFESASYELANNLEREKQPKNNILIISSARIPTTQIKFLLLLSHNIY